MTVAQDYLPSERSSLPLQRYLFALLWVLILARLVLSANALNKVIPYTADGGSTVEKIHPTTYGIFFVLFVQLLTTRIELDDWELRALRALIVFALAIGALAGYTFLVGDITAIGYLIDTYLVACAAGASMLFVPRPWREKLGASLLLFIAVGTCLAVAEYAMKKRFLPYPMDEETFRPTGLSEHPLVLGLYNAVGISFVAVTRWKGFTKACFILLMLLGTFVAGARISSIVAVLSMLLVVALYQSPSMPPDKQFRMKAIVLFGLILAIPAAILALSQFGLLARFQDGLLDNSGMARVNIYGLFELVSWREILFGADVREIGKMALQHFDLEFIESSIVNFVFQFGLFGTIFFLLFMARTFLVLLAGAGREVVVSTLAFFVVAGSNNGLSAKTQIVLMIVLLIVAFHGPPSARRRVAVNSRR
jgi:hypothetical protein